MPPRMYAVGRSEDVIHPDALRAALSEFLGTGLFVFAAEGAVLSLSKIFGTVTNAGGLMMVALASGLALAVAVAIAYNTSGGHVNPAVTLGALLGGRISLLRAVLYWVAQILGAIIATLLLKLATSGMRPAGFTLARGVSEPQAFLLEIVLTFGLVYAVYATAIDPKRGSLGSIAPLIIGLTVAANSIAGGPFDGAAMNPARAFGPAVVGKRWRHHWVYWLGPLIGGALAGLVYEYLILPWGEAGAAGAAVPTTAGAGTRTHLAPEDY